MTGPSPQREVREHPASREVATPAELQDVLADGAPLRGVRLRDLDLAAAEAALLARTDLTGLVVLGGAVSDRLFEHLRRRGALVFPTDAGAPISAYRSSLYTPEELYAGLEQGYAATADARTYAWSRDAWLARDDYVTLLRAIHDESMTDALTETLEGHDVVGVMGGHAMARGSDAYAGAARLGRSLARAGRVVLTGGGPGAMEAANLGALAADADEGVLRLALETLAAVPSFRPSVEDWARVALRVRAEVSPTGRMAGDGPPRSVGVPTWFYGHEPPGVFADGIAKYFSNALREDTLLARCGAGLVVLPGAAGTVQEIFQAVTPLYYAAPEAPVPPLVLVDEHHWRETVPVWPALQALADGRSLAGVVHLVDDVDDAAALVTGAGSGAHGGAP